MEPASAEEIQKQKELREKLLERNYNAPVLAQYICRHHGCRNLEEVMERGLYGNRPDAYSLMRLRTIGVEVGSVKQSNGNPNKSFIVQMDGSKNQVISCPLSPQNTETCLFLDDPRIPEKDQWVHPFTGKSFPGDLSKACIYNVTTRHAWSSFDVLFNARMGHLHSGLNSLFEIEERDKLREAAGAVKGAYMSIAKTNSDGQSLSTNALFSSESRGPTNPEFVRTMALINDVNLMNGLIKLPPDVCRAAKLPMFNGVEAAVPSMEEVSKRMKNLKFENYNDPKEIQRMRQKMIEKWEKSTKGKGTHEYFVLIPIDHVLAWPLRSQDYRMLTNVDVEMFTFNPRNTDGTEADPVLLYFIIASTFFEAMLNDWKSKGPKSWLDKVDMRPLDQVTFEFVPHTDKSQYPNLPNDCKALNGVVALRNYITYAVPPLGLTQEAINQLAPTLSPGFGSADAELTEEQRRNIAVDRYIKYGI